MPLTAPPSPGVGIRAIGTRVPDRVVTNTELEQLFDTTDDWITKYIGVKERRWAADDEWTTDLGAAALLDACERAGVAPETLDLVICGTYTADDIIPAAAVGIMRKVGVEGVPGFDVNSGGCGGGVFALDVGAKFVRSGAYRRVAVVLADVNSKLFDPEDRTVGVIFGDGAACYLLEPTTPGTGVSSAHLASFPSAYYTAYAGREQRTFADGRPKQSAFGDRFAVMNGRPVKDFAMEHIPPLVQQLSKDTGVALDDVDLILFHQANYHLIHALLKEVGLPEEKTFTTVQKYGNTSGSGIALALREAVDAGRVKAGDNVVLVSFGSGMSTGAALVRWAGPDDYLPVP